MDILSLIAEKRIAEAIERGEFKNLPGTGKPLVLENDSTIPDYLRMAYKVLSNAGFLPPELEERKEVSLIIDLLQDCEDEQLKYRQMEKLKLLMIKINSRRSRPIHIADAYYRQIVERISIKNSKNNHSL